MEILYIVAGLLLLVVAVGLWRRARRAVNKAPRVGGIAAGGLAFLTGILLVSVGGVGFWYTHRPLPGDTRETLFEGVTYVRDVRDMPRPLVIHVLLIDLTAPGIELLVTPGNPSPDGEIYARTTSEFLDEFDVQVAINGDFFGPTWSYSPWDYYPHASDPIDVLGLAASDGVVYSERAPNHPAALYLSKDNQAQFDAPVGEVYNAVGGNTLFLERGEVRLASPADRVDLHPRTAAALDRSGQTLILVAVDGRQPNYSEGVTMEELAGIVIEYGGVTALNLDGGGSTTMIAEGESGRALQLNSPIDNRIPGRERPVGNHLGVYARKLTATR